MSSTMSVYSDLSSEVTAKLARVPAGNAPTWSRHDGLLKHSRCGGKGQMHQEVNRRYSIAWRCANGHAE